MTSEVNETDASQGFGQQEQGSPTGDCPPEPKLCEFCGRLAHESKYNRSMAERKKALIRDAKNSESGLTKEARDFILTPPKGENVPEGYEVAHEIPLYMVDDKFKCVLDEEDNMKTELKGPHRASHKRSGSAFHQYPRPKIKR